MTARLLILGGTTEARRLAERLKDRTDLSVTLSLAGRTKDPAPLPVPTRIGGFGGAEGLAAYLTAEGITMLIDATHPFAAIISTNASQAARTAGVPLLALRRAPWTPHEGDQWTMVPDMEAAVAALGQKPRRAFLALGRKELAPFEAAPQHAYVIRSVDPVEPPLAVPHATYVLARGPFTQSEDDALLAAHGIEVIVCKNSGGKATSGKLAAARERGLPVIMVERPEVPQVRTVRTVEQAVGWIDQRVRPSGKTKRGE